MSRWEEAHIVVKNIYIRERLCGVKLEKKGSKAEGAGGRSWSPKAEESTVQTTGKNALRERDHNSVI